jgi:hypothetical protein
MKLRIAEPQGGRIDRHEVHADLLHDPTTDRRALVSALGEPACTQSLGETNVVDPRDGVDDAVDVLSRPRWARCRICEEQFTDHAADEDDLVQDVAEAPGDCPELAGRFHSPNLRSIS